MDQVNISKKIQQFVEFYEGISKQGNFYVKVDNEAAEMDKKTVIDLCNHMFHAKEDVYDTEDRIREYENEQGELIFECFQDEVS